MISISADLLLKRQAAWKVKGVRFMKKKGLIKTVCGALCAVTVLTAGAVGFALSKGDGEEAFTPVFRMAVCSDTHVTQTNPVMGERFQKFFDTAYAYADGQEVYKTLDACVVTGDLTHTGEAVQMKNFRDIVTKNLRKETEFLSILGNHDGSVYNADGVSNIINTENYQTWVHGEVDRHIEVKGFHLIGLSNYTSNGDYTQAQLDFMSESLAKAKADDPEKPIFAFQHQHIKNTVEGSKTQFNVVKLVGETYDTATAFESLYELYPQTIHFSGHSHTPSASPLSVYQDKFTCVDVGSSFKNMSYGYSASWLKEFSGVDALDNIASGLPQNTAAANLYRIVEVDGENRVRILTYDMLSKSLVKTPANTDAADKILSFELGKVTNPDKFTYTMDRKDSASAPYFESGANVTASELATTTAKISFPQAKDGQCLAFYKVVCTPTSGDAVEFAFIDDFYLAGRTEADESFSLTGLTANTAYSVSVTPYNIWGKAGAAITGAFTTAA